MQEKKPTKNYKDLPETITPYDYADWRGIGENKAREIFNSKGFPKLKGTGVKQLADKRGSIITRLRFRRRKLTNSITRNSKTDYLERSENK